MSDDKQKEAARPVDQAAELEKAVEVAVKAFVTEDGKSLSPTRAMVAVKTMSKIALRLTTAAKQAVDLKRKAIDLEEAEIQAAAAAFSAMPRQP